MSGAILTEKSRRALVEITKLGKTHTYKLKKELGFGWSTAQDSISRLKRGNLIRFMGEEEGEKGQSKRIYGPTVFGLGFALQRAIGEEDWTAVDEIARSNGDLFPLILGKWDHFKQMGVEDQARTRLKSAIVRHVVSPKAWDESCGTMDEGKMLRKLKRHFFARHTLRCGDEEKRQEWYRALGKDPEIFEFVRPEIEEEIEQMREAIKGSEEYLQNIKKYSKK